MWLVNIAYFIFQETSSGSPQNPPIAWPSVLIAIAAAASAITSIVAATIASRTGKTQNRNARIALSATLVQQQSTAFNGEAMKVDRRAAARVLTDPSTAREHYSSGQRIPYFQNITRVLNFFERMGAYVKRGDIDEYLAYLEFNAQVHAYWHAAHPLIDYIREQEGEPAN